MTRDAERVLTLGILFTLLFVGFWLALSDGHRHLVFQMTLAFLFVLLVSAIRRRPRKQEPN